MNDYRLEVRCSGDLVDSLDEVVEAGGFESRSELVRTILETWQAESEDDFEEEDEDDFEDEDD